MPLVNGFGYQPGWLFRNAHASTMIPSTVRKVLAVSYVRRRLELPDGDFLDLDWSRVDAPRAVVICHGLEGDAQRPYMQGMVRAFNAAGWDAVAMNFRGCSGEINRLPRSYHSGATEDLRAVLLAVGEAGYREIVLVGFSLGGNLVLKYLGEDPPAVLPAVRAAVTISAPVDLAGTSAALTAPGNRLYHFRFMRKLRRKIRDKARVMPDRLDIAPLAKVRNIIEFDDAFTAPLHGFADAADYYARNSAQNWLDRIQVPTLLLTASNDPILGPGCFPRAVAAASRSFHLEETAWGGHVGFRLPGPRYYSEVRAVAFAREVGGGKVLASSDFELVQGGSDSLQPPHPLTSRPK